LAVRAVSATVSPRFVQRLHKRAFVEGLHRKVEGLHSKSVPAAR
jgi:hypothetical protein